MIDAPPSSRGRDGSATGRTSPTRRTPRPRGRSPKAGAGDGAPEGAAAAQSTDETKEASAEEAAVFTTPKTREGSKQAQLIAMLREGAMIDAMVAATERQSHTVRGAMAGVLKKRLGLTLASEKEERGRVYCVVD